MSLLREANIPYKINKLDGSGDDYIVWDWQYDTQVQNLLMDLYDKFGFTKKPIKRAFFSQEERENFLNMLNKENIPYKVIKNDMIARTKKMEDVVIEYDWKYYLKIQRLSQEMYSKQVRNYNSVAQ